MYRFHKSKGRWLFSQRRYSVKTFEERRFYSQVGWSGVNRGGILSDRIEKLTQQLQLQVEPSELVSGHSPQKLVLRIQAREREGEAIGTGLPLRISTDGEGVRFSEGVILDGEGKAEVEV